MEHKHCHNQEPEDCRQDTKCEGVLQRKKRLSKNTMKMEYSGQWWSLYGKRNNHIICLCAQGGFQDLVVCIGSIVRLCFLGKDMFTQWWEASTLNESSQRGIP